MGLFDRFDFEDGLMASWRDDAACKGMTHIFYPPPLGVTETPQGKDLRIEQCRSVCNRCPSFDPCQQWSIENPGEGIDMVLAGMTYEERRGITRG